MSVTVVLGSQFGDEGKGKLVDVLLSSGKFSLVARCAGGHNAGHTLVVNGQSFDFHILPSGLLAPDTANLIGNGTVVHVPQFFKELKNLGEKGINYDGRIFISDRAHVLFSLRRSSQRAMLSTDSATIQVHALIPAMLRQMRRFIKRDGARRFESRDYW
ncbi:hypothetical protein MMC24_005336 [Lignoscripta atroalba]|nr:hypothetical protein [Lignoscripta atroalba]